MVKLINYNLIVIIISIFIFVACSNFEYVDYSHLYGVTEECTIMYNLLATKELESNIDAVITACLVSVTRQDKLTYLEKCDALNDPQMRIRCIERYIK